MHEIDTKKFLAEQISQDINKFRNADAFLNAGRERINNIGNGNNLVSSAPDIIEDIMEREVNYEEDNDDNTSTLSKELMLAKQ